MNPKKLSAKTRYIICIILMWIGHILGFTGLLIRDNDSFGVSLYMTIIFTITYLFCNKICAILQPNEKKTTIIKIF